jgi:hypothetical protein
MYSATGLPLLPNTIGQGTQNTWEHTPPSGAATHPSDPAFDGCRFDTRTQAVLRYSTDATLRFPHMVAWAPAHVFMTGPDGEARRFPPDGAADAARPQLPDDLSGSAQARHLTNRTIAMGRHIHDFSHRHGPATVTAGYEVYVSSGVMAYLVNGEITPSLLADRGVYPLGKGPSGKAQYMVCQSGMQTSGHDCVQMLLAQGRSMGDVSIQLDSARRGQATQDLPCPPEKVIELLATGLGQPPVVVTLQGVQHEAGLRELKRCLAEHGPCMLGFSGDRWVVLDALKRVSPNVWSHRIRSPLHGTVVNSLTSIGPTKVDSGLPAPAGTAFNRSASDDGNLRLLEATVAIFPATPDDGARARQLVAAQLVNVQPRVAWLLSRTGRLSTVQTHAPDHRAGKRIK